MIEAEALESRPFKIALGIYKEIIDNKFLKVFHYIATISNFPYKFLFKSILDVELVLFLSLIYSLLSGDYFVCLLSSHILFWYDRKVNTISGTDFSRWVAVNFNFPDDHLRIIIFNLNNLKADSIARIPQFILKTFEEIAEKKSINLENINGNDLIPYRDVEIDQELATLINDLVVVKKAVAMFCNITGERLVAALQYFDPRSEYSRSYMFNTIELPATFFLCYIHGLMSRVPITYAVVNSFFAELPSVFYYISPADMATWFDKSFRTSPCAVLEAISYHSEINSNSGIPCSKLLLDTLNALQNRLKQRSHLKLGASGGFVDEGNRSSSHAYERRILNPFHESWKRNNGLDSNEVIILASGSEEEDIYENPQPSTSSVSPRNSGRHTRNNIEALHLPAPAPISIEFSSSDEEFGAATRRHVARPAIVPPRKFNLLDMRDIEIILGRRKPDTPVLEIKSDPESTDEMIMDHDNDTMNCIGHSDSTVVLTQARTAENENNGLRDNDTMCQDEDTVNRPGSSDSTIQLSQDRTNQDERNNRADNEKSKKSKTNREMSSDEETEDQSSKKGKRMKKTAETSLHWRLMRRPPSSSDEDDEQGNCNQRLGGSAHSQSSEQVSGPSQGGNENKTTEQAGTSNQTKSKEKRDYNSQTNERSHNLTNVGGSDETAAQPMTKARTRLVMTRPNTARRSRSTTNGEDESRNCHERRVKHAHSESPKRIYGCSQMGNNDTTNFRNECSLETDRVKRNNEKCNKQPGYREEATVMRHNTTASCRIEDEVKIKVKKTTSSGDEKDKKPVLLERLSLETTENYKVSVKNTGGTTCISTNESSKILERSVNPNTASPVPSSSSTPTTQKCRVEMKGKPCSKPVPASSHLNEQNHSKETNTRIMEVNRESKGREEIHKAVRVGEVCIKTV